MTRSEIAAQLKTFLETELYNQGVELNESTDLLDGWFVDSIGIIQTTLFVESQFGITMARADINGANFQNIATLSEFVLRRLGT